MRIEAMPEGLHLRTDSNGFKENQQVDHSAKFTVWLERAISERVAAGCAITLARDRHLAEDVLQEAYQRAWQHHRRIESEAHLRNWLRRVVINLVREHRRRKQNSMCSLKNVDLVADDQPRKLQTELREEINHYLNRLSENDRLLIELHYFEGQTLQEIHALFPESGSVSTLCKRLATVCRQLRVMMSKTGLDAVAPKRAVPAFVSRVETML